MGATDPVPPAPERFSIRLTSPLGIATAAVVVAVGLRIALPAYRQGMALREVKRSGGSVETLPRGPEWLRDLLGEERMSVQTRMQVASDVRLRSLKAELQHDRKIRQPNWVFGPARTGTKRFDGLCLMARDRRPESLPGAPDFPSSGIVFEWLRHSV
jgi:hypothetical protein